MALREILRRNLRTMGERPLKKPILRFVQVNKIDGRLTEIQRAQACARRVDCVRPPARTKGAARRHTILNKHR